MQGVVISVVALKEGRRDREDSTYVLEMPEVKLETEDFSRPVQGWIEPSLENALRC